jgi:divalent metal cation (Fe/Co/Zn/Cd) transporter
VGVVLNAAFGWWWADPLSGLMIVYHAIRESIGAWRLTAA